MIRTLAALPILLCMATNHATAVPIQFTYTGVVAGTIGEISFSATEVTISAIGDTAARVELPNGVFEIVHSAVLVAIEGTGDFTLTSPTRTFVNPSNGVIGFSRAEMFSQSDLISFKVGPEGQGWSLQESLGPTTGTQASISSIYKQWTLVPPVLTDSGRLILLNSGAQSVTFQAQVIPEPSTYLLGALALLGLFAFHRRKTWGRTKDSSPL